MHAFEVAAVKERLREAGGGYEIVQESAGLEVDVYSLAGVLEVEHVPKEGPRQSSSRPAPIIASAPTST